MQAGPVPIAELKQRMRATWMAGDFGQIAQYAAKASAEFVDRLGIKAGDKVLDVACGNGNLAIPAARTGAQVTGIDIATNLVQQARQRAAAEGVPATFDEGDAEQMPYPEGAFDIVMSSFGAMFAVRPERAAAEMIRVCRPGGSIAMANWTPWGFVAKVFAVGARFVPPPQGIPSPLLWGDESTVRSRLANGTTSIRTSVRKVDFDFPFGPAEVVELFRRFFGPVHLAFLKLDPQKQAEYAAALEKLWTEHNEDTTGRTLVHADYLEVIATRA